jgi:hypothetical protein
LHELSTGRVKLGKETKEAVGSIPKPTLDAGQTFTAMGLSVASLWLVEVMLTNVTVFLSPQARQAMAADDGMNSSPAGLQMEV